MSYRSLFISHGAPDIAVRAFPAHEYLKTLSREIGNPKAIIILSAHNEADDLLVSSKDDARAIYDFGGFAPELRQITYRAPGDAALAERVAETLRKGGFQPRRTEQDYDHGVWTPLHLIRPQADIPIVQVSVQPGRDAAYHYELGRALAPLADEGVLLVGSGALTHNLSAFFRGGYGQTDESPEWVKDFAHWVAEAVEQGDAEALVDWEKRAPHARQNHPTPEHFLPFFFALGAGSSARGQRLHQSSDHAVIAMDVYGWA